MEQQNKDENHKGNGQAVPVFGACLKSAKHSPGSVALEGRPGFVRRSGATLREAEADGIAIERKCPIRAGPRDAHFARNGVLLLANRDGRFD
jgi:hypothetical protein